MRVKLSSMPNPKDISSVALSNFSGGLNLRDDPTEVRSSQSPDMLNMWYRDGVLKKRGGQKQIIPASVDSRADGYTWFYDKLFNGLVVYVDGTSIKYFDPYAELITVYTVSGTKIPDGTPHGTFFPFDERLYYKASGIYLRLSYSAGSITAENLLWKSGDGYEISDSVYAPIIAINRNPNGTGGDLYQPENRINPAKTVWFDIDDESYDYYLPAHGCRVTKVQLNDTVVDTSGGTSRTFEIEGRSMTIVDEGLASTSPNYTHLSFDVPLYIDETGWYSQDWSSSPSTGWNYLSNAVYSTFPVVVNEDMAQNAATVIRYADHSDLPDEIGMSLLQYAKSMCPYSGYRDYFVLDNGEWMNVIFVSYSGTTPTSIVDYDPDTTEMWIKNYFRVCYSYKEQTWTSYDMTGMTSTGWHYGNNCVYSSVKMTCTKDGTTYTVIEKGAGPAWDTYPMSRYSIEEWAFLNSGQSSGQSYTLAWVAANESYWVFHYVIAPNKLIVSNYDPAAGWFQTVGTRDVTVMKNNPMDVSWRDITEPGQWGYYVKNILWAGVDLKWYQYQAGQTILPASNGALPDEYRKYVETAKYRAKRDYPNVDFTGDYIVAQNGEYVTVYLDAGMELTYYDEQTGEFKAVGWVSESFKKPKDTYDISVDLATPAVKSNKLRVTYEAENADAMKAIADCEIATSFGGSDAVCVVLGGCDAQPNAIFWSGNGSYGVDATYFPMDQFNLCGTYQDPVTGFGKQQNALIVFQEHHTSRASYGIETIGERKYIDLKLSTINAERGCDMPCSIALCGNNLVWMHSRYGVMYLKATTSAYENMIVCISDNVNGSAERHGLLKSISGLSKYRCIGMEDGQRYYAFCGMDLYVWDYSLSIVSDGITGLSWGRHSGFDVQAAVEADTGHIWMLDGMGRVSEFDESIHDDFGENIPCHYTTPTQTFGGYYRRRNIGKVILSMMSQDGGSFRVRFGHERHICDTDNVDQGSTQTMTLRCPAQEFPRAFVLKPRGLHVHHLWIRVESDGDDGVLWLMGGAIYYTTAGVTK